MTPLCRSHRPRKPVSPVVELVRRRAGGLDCAHLPELGWSPDNERKVLGEHLEVVIRHRGSGPTMLRDLAAALAAAEDTMDELIRRVREFHVWLAGPEPSVADRLRAVAAIETVGSMLSSGLLPDDASDEVMREIVLDVALAVLDRRENLSVKHLGQPGGR